MTTAIVTGGSMGLGRALAEALHRLGWSVVTDGRRPDRLADLVERVGPERVVAIPGDVADPAHRRDLVDAAVRIGRLELLVNNASTIGESPMPRLDDFGLERWRRVYEVNVVAPLALSQLVIPHLVPGRGRILNISSDAAVEAYPAWGGYGSSKAALDQLSRVLAAEHPELSVYSADPGDMRTEMHQEAFPGEDISDRPPPEASVPGLLALVLGEYESGRYVARELVAP
jgi:NAD(P)-dependent dehydrogenase (short-subunit alcohol dehydrogenase family)